MMSRLTAQEIEAIRKRAESATEGPWDYDIEDFGISNGNFMVLNPEEFEVCGNLAPIINAKISDINFICEAREDIPKLLAEVERLQSQVDRMVSSAYEYLDTSAHTYMVAEEIEREDA